MPHYEIRPNPDSPALFDLYQDGVLYQAGIGNDERRWLEVLIEAANGREKEQSA